ncbi:MAG: S-layer homology domain-containing protein [Oscillibacter sp.]|nr:S-layer homology domain-containing protein [Oscillibacter sp.]
MYKTKRKLLSIVLSLAMALSLLPATALAVQEAGYNVWVSGREVTPSNMNDVLGDGKVVYTPATDEAAAKLTLTDATITGADEAAYSEMVSAGIISYSPLELVLSGTNTIRVPDKRYTYGILARDTSLTISGDGSLTITCGNGEGSYGIVAGTDLTINGGTITAQTGTGTNFTYGISANETVTIQAGTVSVSASATSGIATGINAINGITINGGTVTASGGSRAFSKAPTIGFENPAVMVNTNAAEEGATEWNEEAALGGNDSPFKYVHIEPAPAEKTLTGISITTNPTKMEYTEGETFDSAGMVVTASYSDDTTAEVMDYTVSPDGALTLNDTTITVSYTEGEVTETATLTITVVPIPTYTVSFNANGGTGEMADVTEVTGAYPLPANGFTAPEGQQFKAWAKDSANGDPIVPGTEVTIDADTTFYALWETIPEDQKTLTGIEITTPPTKTEYNVGESFDPAGMVVTASYEDGTTAEVTDYAVSPAGALTADTTAITVTYTDGGITQTATQAITVTAPAGAYTITFDPGVGTVDPTSAVTDAEGKLTELPEAVRSGRYSFTGWFTAAEGGTRITTETVFTENTTVYAQYEYIGTTSGGGGGGGSSTTTYTLTFQTNGGSRISSISGSYGRTIDLSDYTPTRTGYSFDGWYANESLSRSITQVRLTGDTTVYAGWTLTGNPFTDVDEDDYYYDAVQWAVANGVTTGTTSTRFSPDTICTRAQMVTFLWRAVGSPAASGTLPFTDVSTDAYYYDAVRWAYRNGVTVGTTSTTFSPDRQVTRAQVTTMLYRYNNAPAVSSSMPFADVPTDAYYYNAVRWAVANGITQGTTSTTFSPARGCTRAQIVVFLYRAMEE